MRNRLPTFLGIGAHKAGTTWLFEQLSTHPEVWLPTEKELHYFDRAPRYPSPNTLATSSPLGRLLGSNPWERPQLIKGLKTVARAIKRGNLRDTWWRSKWLLGYYDDDWYRGLFSQGTAYSSCGEITPSYSILDEDDIARIKAMNPDMKLIFMIRNPIERAWSAIRFNADRGFSRFNIDSAEEIIAALEQPGMVLRGDYERTLNAYLTHFDAKQILVCFYDAIKLDKAGLMAAVTTFLGVAPFPDDTIDNERRVNASPPRRMPEKIREYLVATHTPMIERMARTYGSYALQWESSVDPYRATSKNVVRPHNLRPAFHP